MNSQPRRPDKPTEKALNEHFLDADLTLTEHELSQFWSFHQLLYEKNDEWDLTRLKNFESLAVRHYVDSAVIARMIDPPGPILDIGTGAGFPGIPLKIMKPDWQIILAESRGKKLLFLDLAIDSLGLKGIEVFPHKVNSRFDLPIRSMITRDLESMSTTLERCLDFLPERGWAVFMKGPSVDEELGQAMEEFGDEFRLHSDQSYRLGRTSFHRRLIVLERTTKPRRTGALADNNMVQEIASANNPKFKSWEKLLDSKGVKKQGLALISGTRQVREIVRDSPELCTALIGKDRRDAEFESPSNIPVFRLRPELFRALDRFGTGPPLLVVKTPSLSRWSDLDWPLGLTLFIPFQDPGNVGTVIRTAAALGAARIVLLKEAAHPFHPRSLRSAGPAIFRVPLFEGPSIEDLTSKQAPLISLSTQGVDITRFDFPPRFGLIPGVEGPGLPDHLKSALTVSIPMSPGVESLNAATASAIALYEWRRQTGSP